MRTFTSPQKFALERLERVIESHTELRTDTTRDLVWGCALNVAKHNVLLALTPFELSVIKECMPLSAQFIRTPPVYTNPLQFSRT